MIITEHSAQNFSEENSISRFRPHKELSKDVDCILRMKFTITVCVLRTLLHTLTSCGRLAIVALRMKTLSSFCTHQLFCSDGL